VSHPGVGRYFPGAGLDWTSAGCEGETDPTGAGDLAGDTAADGAAADGAAGEVGVADVLGLVETYGDAETAAVAEALGFAAVEGETNGCGVDTVTAFRTSFSRTPALWFMLRRAVRIVSRRVTAKNVHPR
jgi:hypothetical protein